MAGGAWPRRTARLETALRRHVGTGAIPGVVALVARRGRTHEVVLGSTGFDAATPMRRDALFRLASSTKPITAAGAMLLVEECRLRLDDPLDDWLPELADRRVLRSIESALDDTVPAARPLTLRDLLTFRSGLGEAFFLSPACPFQQALSGAGLSLYHTSGEILGVLIARVAGTSLGAFLRERIFEPLGMPDTGFHVPREQLHRLPPCYGSDMVTGERVLLYEAGAGYPAQPPPFESGAGGLVSTADDLVAFGRMMLGAPGPAGERVLSRATIDTMTRDHLTPAQKALSPFFGWFWDTYGWGLGVGVVTTRTDVASAPGRFGWDGAFGTSWGADPREDLVGVVLTQRRPARLALPPIVLDFWTSVYQSLAD